jgi:hypothetical protein
MWPGDAVPSADFFNANLEAGQQKSIDMLQLAATIDVEQIGGAIDVRVTNETGHKLPTGYPEGRRMWLNVQYFDAADQLIAERGGYDLLNADLDIDTTKVYEIHLGLDTNVADATGLPEGVSFHFALNNKIYKDNRIPPRGFTNAAYEAFGGAHVGATYADFQYWDDTGYALVEGAASVTVGLYFQTSSKDYIEFLRDENITNEWGNRLYAGWELAGKSEPVLMAGATVSLSAFVLGDADGDLDADLDDFATFDDCFTGPDSEGVEAGCSVFDFDSDGDVDKADLAKMQQSFTG